ncbi:Rnf-Nqr domain containing protein [Candidatus Oleimmundimicrobium sp.]|uniref:electron transport complex protein RnfA n=1 Tax=Candidatus Oleimmundimicrobium sp. TaxID=3060597 RepID=UPI002722FDC7|nr:Rnf-Nqr domain containing protein [Candidatus Oleimmundimicrobium sp.]MDO8886133.1 Rnf-Nqr domain containing protein [Candidatus Oleimmundimicrobium sp.]
MERLFLIFLAAFLINNILLIRFIGLCPFFGVSSRFETSIGMSMAVIFVMTLSSMVCWGVWNFLLNPLGVGDFLYIPAFILVIASLVQFVEMVIRKVSPALFKAMGIYLPLITTNCAVLAAATESVKPGFWKLSLEYNYSLGEALVYTIGIALGFSMVIIMFAAMRERIEIAPIPRSFKGFPIAFIAAGLSSLAFLGFKGLFGI